MVASSNHLDFPYGLISPAVPTINTKIHTNNKISYEKLGSSYLGLDISNFYIGTLMSYHQYMCFHPVKTPQ